MWCDFCDVAIDAGLGLYRRRYQQAHSIRLVVLAEAGDPLLLVLLLQAPP